MSLERRSEREEEGRPALPLAAIAVQMLELRRGGRERIVFVARGERRAAALARMLHGLWPTLDLWHFPSWDCVPYDRAPPSREVMGRRIEVLRRLNQGSDTSWLLVSTPEALSQRSPPRSVLSQSTLRIAPGDALAVDALERFLKRTGYIFDDRVDEAGEAALRGSAIDLFPAGADQPYRLDHAEGLVTGIRRYDPASQRTLDEAAELVVLPASEVVLPEPGEGEEPLEHYTGVEHRIAELYPSLETVLEYAAGAAVILDDGAEEARAQFWDQVVDGYETRRSVPGSNGGKPPLPPEGLYLRPEEWTNHIASMQVVELRREGVEPAPRVARERDPRQALGDFIRDQIGAGRRLVLAAAASGDLQRLKRQARRGVGIEPTGRRRLERGRGRAPSGRLRGPR
jgi:transcription-repair coupling factor (superfamily II helicase)